MSFRDRIFIPVCFKFTIFSVSVPYSYYSAKPLVVILSPIVDDCRLKNFFHFFFQNFIFKYMAIFIKIPIGHTEN